MRAHWEHFPHEADMGVRGIGPSEAQAFEQAALAMTAIITDPSTIQPLELIRIECEAPDDALLLAEWLNSLLYEMSTRQMLFGRFAVELGQGALRGRAWGERVDPERHHPAVEVKGVTYTSLRVAQEEGTWIAQTVVDV